MAWLRRLVGGLGALARKQPVEQELDAELRAYLEVSIEEKMRAGMTREDASRAARVEMGSLEAVKDHTRDVGWEAGLESLCRDVRYAGRILRKSPAFSTVAVLSLAIGIGASSAIFSVIDTLVFRTLPISDPDAVVIIRALTRQGDRTSWSHGDYEWLNEHNDVFSGVAASASWQFTRTLPDGTERIQGQLVSGNYFAVLGVVPLLGRAIEPIDDALGHHPVAVIGYSYWLHAFGGNPGALGQTMRFGDTTVEIIGIAPEGFAGEHIGSRVDVWVPLSMQPQLNSGQSFLQTRNVSWLQMMARLRPGVSIREAAASMDVLLGSLQVALSVNARSDYLGAMSIEPGAGGFSDLRERYRRPLWVLMGLVALVLTIGCVNVTSLVLARSEARQREFAVRLAIGADRSRLVRQMLTEAGLLAVIACAVGMAAAELMVRLLLALSDVDGVDVRLNLKVLAFATGVSLAVTVIVGLAPAVRSRRVEPWFTLRQSGTRFDVAGRRITSLQLLVAGQTAIALVVLIASGLLLRTFLNLKTMDPGFEKNSVLQVTVATPDGSADGVALGRQLVERLSQVPGVQSVSFSGLGFAQGARRVCCVDVEGYTPSPDEDRNVRVHPISPGYLATMGIPLLSGRDFTDRDGPTAPEVVVINEAMARYYFGDASPLGKRLAWWPADPKNVEIIGVAKDAKYDNLRQETPRIVYQSILQRAAAPPVLQVRISPSTGRSAAGVIQDSRAVIESTSPHIATPRIEPLWAAVDRTLRVERLAAGLSLGFGVTAVVLTSIGVYGVLAFAVARRTSEIGIRMALGAQPAAILRLLVREGLAPVLLGLIVGAGASYALATLLGSLLYGVPPRDLPTFLLALVILIAVATLASYGPARRATDVDPTIALRAE